MHAYDLLARKRRGEELSTEEIGALIRAFTSGELADYQMTAFLMAVAIQGMTPQETWALTEAMLASGEQWQLRERFDFVADKHSTGGVGDKISLSLAPIVAASGVNIAMLSGRGLGHTGGTLDKLEAIEGFDARLSRERFERTVRDAGCAIGTSTDEIAPADRRMYALRDVTATVDSIPLITASILSKKLALGASALVLDVKVGQGAFMRDIDSGRELARSILQVTNAAQLPCSILLTRMDEPLGCAVGNANEVAEAIDIVCGRGPADTTALTEEQGLEVLVLSGRYDRAGAAIAVREAVSSGRAREAMSRWIAAQGGDAGVVEDPSRLPQPSATIAVSAPRDGYITAIDGYGIGLFATTLGAGRRKQDDTIDPAAGVVIDCRVGDQIRAGQIIARVQIGRTEPGDVGAKLLSLFTIADNPPREKPLILERLQS